MTNQNKKSIRALFRDEWIKRMAKVAASRFILIDGSEGEGKGTALRLIAEDILGSSVNNPDLIEFSSGKIGIEELREVLSRLYKSSFSEQGMVVVLEDAERLSIEAQQALLKTLEELPQKTTFLMSTSCRARVLSTIISRSLVVRLPRILPAELISALNKDFGLSEEDAKSILALSMNRPALAYRLAELGMDWINSKTKMFEQLPSAGISERFKLADKELEQSLELFILIYAAFLKIKNFTGIAAADTTGHLRAVLDARDQLRDGQPRLVLSRIFLGA